MANQMDRWIAEEGDPAKIADRITAIYINRGYNDLLPPTATMDKLVQHVIDRGAGYFDTIRKTPERYVSGIHDPRLQVDGEIDPEPEPANLRDAVELRMPWLPPELVDLYADAYAEYGDPQTAIAAVREDPRYDSLFPGIKRDDGSLRSTEQEYLSEMEGYGEALESYGVPASTFSDQFVELFSNGVTARQFRQNVSQTYSEIATLSVGMRQYYADEFGAGDISTAALLASALDPQLDPLTAEREFRIAKIGGAGADAGFDIALSDAERMADFGLNRQAATDFFTRAKTLVPTLGQLASRHNDPDDDFDIEEATEALIFQDPEQARRVRNLFAREESEFKTGGALRTDEQGAVTGLTRR